MRYWPFFLKVFCGFSGAYSVWICSFKLEKHLKDTKLVPVHPCQDDVTLDKKGGQGCAAKNKNDIVSSLKVQSFLESGLSFGVATVLA